MPNKNNLALPARMDLANDSLSEMTIAVLMFPFPKEVQSFCKDIEQALRSKNKTYPPYRQLNNALLACSSTLTYGFEYLKVIDDVRQYRALAVGKSKEELNIPTSEQIYELIYIWARTWIMQFFKRQGNKDEIESVCDRFLDRIAHIPQDWNWEYLQPEILINNINSKNGLGYQAIPSLLVTLLHEITCVISAGGREQNIKWRKVQGGGSTRTGLHLVSQPFKATYIDDDKEKYGYFAYRLDFYLHTQAGRFNLEGHLKPWIFLHLSCQRYAHEHLLNANYGRDISVLIGMNQARMDNYPIDSTLVRLTIKNNDKKYWQEQLPDLLSAFKARPLINPQDILNNPTEYSNLDNVDDWSKDEYYIVHSEGYEYKQESQKGRGHGHYIKTGFSLKERADITNQLLQLLDGVLIPDKPMEYDIAAPSSKKTLLAMSDYEWHRKSLIPSAIKSFTEEEKRIYIENKQTIIADAIKRSVNKNQLYLFIIYSENYTRKLIHQQLRRAFLLQDDDNFPEYINLIDICISEPNLLQKLHVTGLPSINENFNDEIKKEYLLKRKAWQSFLKKKVIALVDKPNNSNIYAILEIGKTKESGIHPQQNIRGAVREACILENINSQMLQTVKPKKIQNPEDEIAYNKATEGRVLNAVLDLILRQTGTLYGLPSEVYKIAQLPEDIAQNLDVIAFCRVQKNNFQGQNKFQYAIAVRLAATGAVDVLLPNSRIWIPYSRAGIVIGKLFHQARNKDRDSLNQVQMRGGQLVKFVADVLSQHIENPTIALIEADVWRNEKSKDASNNQAWYQLKNEYLLEQRDILDFNHVFGHNYQYKRDNKNLNNLLCIIRLRSGKETPQYVTNRTNWGEDSIARDFTKLSGFIDRTVPELLHYFSIGRIPDTQKKTQDTLDARELYKSDRSENVYAANIAYKHQQMVEMLPFFVRPDFQSEDNLKALCRAPHFLRISPAFTKGNIIHPYPMHLGIILIEDLLCILDLD